MILVPVGGFLGAGKTTLILAAARVLKSRGRRAAAIFNDQASDLVDTRLAAAQGVDADQVAGGCFCCRFSDLIDAAERLQAHAPDVIFAEAVGSCTDISATTLQPLKRLYAERFRVAPYSVLVDPALRREDSPFLFEKQIAEADLICFTRADLHREFPHLEGAPLRYLSGVTGQGVAEWLDEVLEGGMPAGGSILDLDYEEYARAEAELAWLNCTAAVKLREALSPAMLAGPLLEGLDAALAAGGFRIAHLKLMDETAAGYLKASQVRNGEEPAVEGMLAASPAWYHILFLNIRAAGDPDVLRRIVEEHLAALPGELEVRAMQAFRPAPPRPEHREKRVYV
jgi:Ni2+-binding GTPase involved in maturation of urease and hydrogenase